MVQWSIPRLSEAGRNGQHCQGQGGKPGRHTHTSPIATGGIYKQEGWMEWEKGCSTGDCQHLWAMVWAEQRDLDEGEKSKSDMGMDKQDVSCTFYMREDTRR